MHAHAAISILNGILCGRGAAMAITGGIDATAYASPGQQRIVGAPDDAILRALEPALSDQSINIESTFGPSRGLKTSSGACYAILAALNRPSTPEDCVALARRAGITRTGALDDQTAVQEGGIQLTDNLATRRIASWQPLRWHVAVWHPDAVITKAQFPRTVPPELAQLAAQYADTLARYGARAVPEVMQEVGDALMAWLLDAKLPVRREPIDVALAHGALAASLSGTGPAVAALFAAPEWLPEIPGGTWSWHEPVPWENK